MVLTGEGNGNPLQYSCLENPMDRGAWQAAVYGVAQSWTRLSDFTFTLHFSCIGEGYGNPLQCSCLENPREGRAWWAAVYGGCTESDTTEATQQQQQHGLNYCIQVIMGTQVGKKKKQNPLKRHVRHSETSPDTDILLYVVS